MERANRHLDEEFIANYNIEFARAATDSNPAFVLLASLDLNPILRHEEECTVGRDNVVTPGAVRLQIAKQLGRLTCADLRVTVRRHLDGSHAVTSGTRTLWRFDPNGRALRPAVTSNPSTSESYPTPIAAVRAASETASAS